MIGKAKRKMKTQQMIDGPTRLWASLNARADDRADIFGKGEHTDRTLEVKNLLRD